MFQDRKIYLLVMGILGLVCNKEANGQFPFGGGQGGFRQGGFRQGSVARVNNNAYEREVDLGPIDLSRGVSNSRVVTKNGGGVRNGGTTSVENKNSLSRGVNVAGLPIGSTLTRSQTRNNGAVSRGVDYDVNVGNLGFGASLNPNNLQNGFGLRRQPDGDLSLGLGFLNLGLTDNAHRNNPTTQAQVNAEGRGARVRANSNSRIVNSQFGGVGVQETFLNSNAVGRARFGQTSANLNALVKRSVADSLRRSRRDVALLREKRQFGGRRRPGFGFQQPGFGYQDPGFGYQSGFGYQQPGFGGAQPGFGAQQPGFGSQKRRPQKPSNQQAGANTHSNNQVNEHGSFLDNGASSIGSNIAQDGSSGQVSSANTNQKQSQTADGFQNNNDAQSQALNFDGNDRQATNSNAGTTHTLTGSGEKVGATGGSQATNANEFGTATNIANTNSNSFREGDVEGSNADSSGQSIFQGANGMKTAAFTNSKTESKRGPDGFVSNSASSSASSMSVGGGNANAVASANAGSDGSSADADGFGGNNFGDNGFNSGFNGGFNNGFNGGFRQPGFWGGNRRG